MAKTVFNITRGWYMKRRAAEKAVDDACSCAWVVYGESVRDLTLAESISARNDLAAIREPLPYAEMPGIVFSGKTDFSLIRAAHQFCAQ